MRIWKIYILFKKIDFFGKVGKFFKYTFFLSTHITKGDPLVWDRPQYGTLFWIGYTVRQKSGLCTSRFLNDFIWVHISFRCKKTIFIIFLIFSTSESVRTKNIVIFMTLFIFTFMTRHISIVINMTIYIWIYIYTYK